MPVERRKPKTRIFYKMKQITLPLAPDGEDARTRGLKITTSDIVNIVLKKAPPRLSVEEKKAAFFKPQSAIHLELLSKFPTSKR